MLKPHSSGNIFHNSYVNDAIFGHIPSIPFFNDTYLLKIKQNAQSFLIQWHIWCSPATLTSHLRGVSSEADLFYSTYMPIVCMKISVYNWNSKITFKLQLLYTVLPIINRILKSNINFCFPKNAWRLV